MHTHTTYRHIYTYLCIYAYTIYTHLYIYTCTYTQTCTPIRTYTHIYMGFPGGASGKEPTCRYRRHRDVGLITGLGRFPGGGHGNPLQYSCLENPKDRGPQGATVHGVTKSQMQPHIHPFSCPSVSHPSFFLKKKIISTFFLSSYHFLLEFWLPRIWLFGLECYCSTLKSTESVNMLGSIASFPIKQLLNTTL